MFEVTNPTASAVTPPADEELTEQDIDTAPDPYAIGICYAWKCTDCEHICVELGDPLYLCGRCEGNFSRYDAHDGLSHRCPDCGQFAKRIDDYSCPECCVSEVEDIELVKCPECKEMVEVDYWDDHWFDKHVDDSAV